MVVELDEMWHYIGSKKQMLDMPWSLALLAARVPIAAPNAGIKPYDEESVIKWYNIVLINALTALIEDLNANGEVCLYIGQDGKAYLENDGNITVAYDFGEMPDKKLWVHITEKLGTAGLYAEVQDENRIFISWA